MAHHHNTVVLTGEKGFTPVFKRLNVVGNYKCYSWINEVICARPASRFRKPRRPHWSGVIESYPVHLQVLGEENLYTPR